MPSNDSGSPASADSEDIDWPLVERCFAGAASPVDRARLATWASATAERQHFLDVLQRRWVRARMGLLGPAVDTETALRAVHDRLAVPAKQITGRRTRWPRGHGSWTGRFGLAAAAAVLLAGIIPVVVHVRATTQPFREFATPAGSRSTVTLRDGTHLVLGPATRLRVPTDFGTSSRTVELDGQAYFAVVHNAAQPFAVRTARADVRDVGTTFSVRAYADDADGRVAVTEGKVRVGTASLARGDLAVIDGGGRVAVRHGVDLTPYIAWTQGRLAFDGTPLRDVARELDRAFDVRITIADSGLAGDPVSGTFDNESVDQVLDDITDVIGGDYERVGRAVAIHRRTSKATRHGLGERLYMRMAQVAAPKE